MVSTRLMAGSSTPPSSSSELVLSFNRHGGSAAQQQVFLLDLPQELLDQIFAYVGYKKVAQVRVVSRQMNQVCCLILNSTFQKLQNQIMIRFQNVKAKMPRRESARRNHPLACECDIIETCHMRLSLLQMTFGKHIERKHCCFFPGAILDEILSVLNHVRVTQNLGRPYKVTDELFDLSTMAMEYFKEHIEPGLPELVYFSKSFLDFSSNPKQTFLESSSSSSRDSTYSNAQPSPMVLRKGIRKIKQGMKKYNNQLTVLRNELRNCKKKATEQSKQMAEQQKLIADQQKQTIDYANRLDENDKKNEEMSRKFSTLLQELNKCKTELQYWRSKTPATSPLMCGECGHIVVSNPADPLAVQPNLAITTSVEDLELLPRIDAVEGSMQPPQPVKVSHSAGGAGSLKRKTEDGGADAAGASFAIGGAGESSNNSSSVNNSSNLSNNSNCTEEATVNITNKKARRAKGGQGATTKVT